MQILTRIKNGNKAVDGMLLLAQLYVDALANNTTPKAIREITSKAPSDYKKSKVLDHVYMQSMERINVQVPRGYGEAAS